MPRSAERSLPVLGLAFSAAAHFAVFSGAKSGPCVFCLEKRRASLGGLKVSTLAC